ncbi:hypothetical protein DY468_21050 [Rhodopseudomonas sp. BR0M22]|nr:hypothetical protein [Rhodopseudomonas sp. BR0M22]
MGEVCGRDRQCSTQNYQRVIARSAATKQSSFVHGASGLLRFARNDGESSSLVASQLTHRSRPHVAIRRAPCRH